VKAFRFHREADAEFTAELRWYAETSPDLGNRFYDAVEQILREICAHPHTL
jgi:hypothetical protein